MSKAFDTAVAAKLATLRVGNAIDAGKTAKLTRSIATRGKAMDIDMHSCALAALELSDNHRDANAMKLLLNSMPRNSRATSLAAWAEHFGNVNVSKAKDGSYQVTMRKVEDCQPVDFKAATAKPFFDKPESAPQPFDLSAAVAALLKRAEKHVDAMSAEQKKALADLRVVGVKLTPVEDKANA